MEIASPTPFRAPLFKVFFWQRLFYPLQVQGFGALGLGLKGSSDIGGWRVRGAKQVYLEPRQTIKEKQEMSS